MKRITFLKAKSDYFSGACGVSCLLIGGKLRPNQSADTKLRKRHRNIMLSPIDLLLKRNHICIINIHVFYTLYASLFYLYCRGRRNVCKEKSFTFGSHMDTS